ncbi:MAG: triose-phosphate isomerase [Clostridiales bacterium]|jgi:triosephosphate isomerase|nr:triose-phosphate isomerase [Clostridiales bacterium]
MRKKIIAGNWKMNLTPKEAEDFINSIKDKVNSDKSDVVFCVPYLDLAAALNLLKGTNISVGAQNMYYADKGAFTGEISAPMLAELGVKYVIIGHSERRQFFGETDISVNKKVKKALEYNITPIICVGESLDQRKQGITIELVRQQVKVALMDIPAEQAKNIVMAYEPIWAIGTGETATRDQAEEVCAAVRLVLAEIYGQEAADSVRIQYGGSVNAANAAELFTMPNIDGGLVGGASIKSEFEKVVNYV